MYKTIEVAEPPARTRTGDRSNQIREFLLGGKQAVKLTGIAPEDVSKVYCGLYNASKRKLFGGKVKVMKRGNVVYLYRVR